MMMKTMKIMAMTRRIQTMMTEIVAREWRREKSVADPLPSPPPKKGREPEPEREAAYQAALKLVARVDEDLRRGIRHYRNRAGELLRTLDEVVRAILNDELMTPEVVALRQAQDQEGERKCRTY